MCELLAARTDRPRPFGALVEAAGGLERCGIAGYGWGVAWLAAGPGGAARVRVARGLGRFADEAGADAALAAACSTHFLVHVRRPSRLSTISAADTQPFDDGGGHAWCHNGHLDRAEQLRPAYADRLRGRADSEVGWQYFRDRRAAGAGVVAALEAVDAELGGHVNLGYLGVDGTLALYGRNPANPLWGFRLGEAAMAATGLHSDDTTVFDWLFPTAGDRRRVEPGGTLVLGEGTGGGAAAVAGSAA